MKERGQGTADAIHEHDETWKDMLNRQNETFVGEIANEKEQNHRLEHAMDREMNEAIKEKGAFFTGVIHKQTDEHHREMADNNQNFQRNRDDLIQKCSKRIMNSPTSSMKSN